MNHSPNTLRICENTTYIWGQNPNTETPANIMRTTFNIVLFLTYSITVLSQPDWKEYVYHSYDFKIDFFQKPDFIADSSVFNDSPLVTYFWELNVDDPLHDNIYYSVSHVAYPSEFIHSDSLFHLVDGFISSTQNSLIEDENYTLLSSSLAENNGFPGKVFKWKNKSNNILLEFHVYLVENKLFELSVVSQEGKNHNQFLDKYFDSFEIINIQKGNYTLPDNASERTILVMFPEVPIEQTKTVDSEYGKLSLDIQILEPTVKEDNMIYIAMETKYPSGVVEPGDSIALNNFYEKAVDGALNSVNGDLVSIDDVYYRDIPGKEYRCYLSEGEALMVYRYFFIDDNFYSIGVITLPEKDKNKGMIKFFDSFGIKN